MKKIVLLAVSAAIGTPPSVPIITSSQTELEAEDLSSIGLGYDKWNVAFWGKAQAMQGFTFRIICQMLL